jgi:hypothetical protein
MNVDSHYVIGHAHVIGGKPCQDFALSGLLPDGAFAVVSDGCSSGGQTDIGARLTSLAAAKSLRYIATISMDSATYIEAMVSMQQRLNFDVAVNILGVNHDDLLATSVYAYVGTEQRFVHLHGDGVVAWRTQGGKTMIIRFDWTDNTPSYPVYDYDNYTKFISRHGGDPSAIKLSSTIWQSSPAESAAESRVQYPLSDGIRGITLTIPDDANLIAIFTDGITQVEGLDWTTAVTELLNFKTTAGQFAKRRLNRFVKDHLATGRGPIDDLAYAVIRVDPKETP